MAEWKKVKLGNVVQITSGGTPRKDVKEYYENGQISWVKTGDLKSKYIFDTEAKITEAGLNNSSAKIFPENTLLIAMYGATIGACSILKIPAATNQACAALLPSHDYIPQFLYYYFISRKEKLVSLGVGGAQPNISGAILKSLYVPLPSVNEQKKIADILGKVSDLITERKQQLEKIDLLVKSRFIEMFGDPVTNPMDWNMTTIRAVSQRISDGPFGSNLKSSHYSDNGIRVIRLQNIGVSDFIDNDKVYVSLEHYETIKKYTVKAGEVVIGTLGEPNLRACILPYYIFMAINKADCVHFVPDIDKVDPLFVTEYLNQPATLELASSSIHGQTRSRISMSQVAALPIYLPPLELQYRFAKFAMQTVSLKSEFKQGLYNLELLYDALINFFFGGLEYEKNL